MEMRKILLAIGLVCTLSVSSYAVLMPSGYDAYGIEGDNIVFSAGNGFWFYDNVAPLETHVNIVLDLGSVMSVDTVNHINGLVTSSLGMKRAEVRVASDENAAGFDPTLAASFDVTVFAEGGIGPFDATAPNANLIRPINIVDSTKRYFLIKYTEKFNGDDFTQGNMAGLVGDLDVTLVPEPATLALLAMGSLSFLRRKNPNIHITDLY